MLRTAILRSAALATRTAVRPIPAAAARRLAVAPAPRIASFVPKVAAWQAVRCYASGSSLDKTEVYERIKQLLSGFDKVGLAVPFASGRTAGVAVSAGALF
jgi:NADH dehydrogenase (ubiquinone) 1 alpha/beta subcomplex 1